MPPSVRFRSQWAELLSRKGAALAATGRAAAAGEVVASAVAFDEEIVRGKFCHLCPPWSWPCVWSAVAVELCQQGSEPCHLYDLACHLALASTLSGTGIPDPAGRAVRILRDLASSDFDNTNEFQRDERLAPLRDRPDFQDLLRRLRALAPKQPTALRGR